MLPPLTDLLDPREANFAASEPCARAVNIPSSELAARVSELPPKPGPLRVAATAVEAVEVVEWLLERGWEAKIELHPSTANSLKQWRLWRPNGFLEEALPELRRGDALDLGCGAGREATALAAFGWNVRAVDHLPDALERAGGFSMRYLPTGAPPITWVAARAEAELSKLDRDFDLIFAAFVPLAKWLRPIAERMKAGGSMVVESFSEQHQREYGRPSSPDSIVGSTEFQRLARDKDLEVVFLDEGLHRGRYTTTAWLRRSP